mgnify:CR=1 FL=1
MRGIVATAQIGFNEARADQRGKWRDSVAWAGTEARFNEARADQRGKWAALYAE